MPVITDIKQQKRLQARYSIWLDGQYAFSLSDLDLSNSSLRVGQELAASEVESWLARSSEGKAYDAALRYLSYRSRSEHELKTYLSRKEYDEETMGGVLERLRHIGLADDAAFARSWISNRQLLKPSSRRRLVAELMQKGVPKDVISEALAGLSSDDQDSVLLQIIERKRHLSQYQDKNKLIAYLARQGFGYDEIRRALGSLEEN